MSVATPKQTTRGPDKATPAVPGSGDDALREQAIVNLKRKRRFAQDAVAFVTVNGVLWLIWALTDRTTDGSIPWPAWVTSIWGFFLAIDAWKAYSPWPRSLRHPISEADVEREEERLRRMSAR
jgi:hypothetical protein